VYVPWISPIKNESLREYALRLRKEIPEEHPIIVGISFGGMLATEIARTDESIRAIIISSNKTSAEFPSYLRSLRFFPFYKWLPGGMIKSSARIIKWFMASKGKAQKKLLLQIIRDTDMNFIRWAIPAIINWRNIECPANVVHIHGTNDRILPCSRVKADYIIKGGTHAMPLYKVREISELLRRLIGNDVKV
jgi:pimeloyl-ACP methyl ester carboxylesterase